MDFDLSDDQLALARRPRASSSTISRRRRACAPIPRPVMPGRRRSVGRDGRPGLARASSSPKRPAGSAWARSRSRCSPRSWAATPLRHRSCRQCSLSTRCARGRRASSWSSGSSPVKPARASPGMHPRRSRTHHRRMSQSCAAPMGLRSSNFRSDRGASRPWTSHASSAGSRLRPAAPSATRRRATGSSTAARRSRRLICSAARHARSSWPSSTPRTEFSSAVRSVRSRR